MAAEELVFDADRLPSARLFAVERAARFGLSGGRLEDVALIVAELTTNSVVHGGGSGILWVWADEGRVVCEVRDHGALNDPLMRPPPARTGQARRPGPAARALPRRPRTHPHRPRRNGRSQLHRSALIPSVQPPATHVTSGGHHAR